MLRTDLDGAVLLYNKEAERLCRWAEGRVLGRAIASWLQPLPPSRCTIEQRGNKGAKASKPEMTLFGEGRCAQQVVHRSSL